MSGWGGGDDDGDFDPKTIAEAEGAVRQAELMLRVVREALVSRAPFLLTPAVVCELHEAAMHGVLATAGRYRDDRVDILGSSHVPPHHGRIPELLTELCDYANGWTSKVHSIHVAAYVLWRICWIHPFEDGNGRTARAVSYLMLSMRSGIELPGRILIPDRIKAAPRCYHRALEAGDRACVLGTIDVAEMEQLLAWYLAAQVHEDPPGLPPWA